MSKYFTKIEVPQGVKGSKKFSLANQHITTNGFMRFSIGTFMPVIPKTRFSLSSRTFVRMNPLSHPVYGTAQVKKKLFFVPFRVVFPAWNDFIERAVHHSDTTTQIMNQVPVMSMAALVSVFVNNTSFSNPLTDQTLDSFDFSDSNGRKYNFTYLGKNFYNQLVALGYKVDFTMDISDSTKDYNISALKLLCLAKIYCDYYYNPMYTNTTNYSDVMELFTRNDYQANPTLQVQRIISIAQLIVYTYYQDDYFTTAFDNPVGPVNSNEGNGISIIDNTIPSINTKTRISVSSENTPNLSNTDNTQTTRNLTQYINDALNKLTKYFRRNAFVGGRASARHLAEFGIQLNNEKNNRSVYVDGYEFDIQFSDIMSNADTSTATLGAYAGKGIGSGQKQNMTYFNDEFGYYIEIYHIIPRVGYYQGMSKDTFQIYPLDFYHPDFDNLGMDAVRQAELLIPMKNTINSNNQVVPTWSKLEDKVFGFQPRYLGEYKTKHDLLSGDFLCGSKNTGMDAWHLMRMFDDIQTVNIGGVLDIVHSQQFTRSDFPEQYDRIFAAYDPNSSNKLARADNFIINNQYWYEITAPMKGAYDMLEFDPEDRKITMNLEGRHEA